MARLGAVDAAYVVWANATGAAWSAFDNAVAAAGAVQALADAQSANDGWHAINSAAGAESTANSTAGNAYSHAVTALEGAFFGTLDPAWKTFADAVSDASTASTVAGANAYSAAVGRWAGQQGSSPYAAHTAAIEAAKAAKTVTTSAAYNTSAKAQHTAAVGWNASVVPAWVTKQNEVSDHASAKLARIVPAWVTKENAVEDADLAKTTAAVPLGTALTATLDTNFTAWVSSVSSADAAYGDALVDHAETRMTSATSAGDSCANATLAHWTTYIHAGSALDSLVAATVSQAFVNWAGTVAGQLTGTPYTPLSNVTTLTQSSSSNSNGSTVVAFGAAAAQAPAQNGVGWGEWLWDVASTGVDIAAGAATGAGHGGMMVLNAVTFHQIDAVDTRVDKWVAQNGGAYKVANGAAHVGAYAGMAAGGLAAAGINVTIGGGTATAATQFPTVIAAGGALSQWLGPRFQILSNPVDRRLRVWFAKAKMV